MSFSRFNPGCCCGPCEPFGEIRERLETEETEIMESVTYNRFDFPEVDGDHIWAAAYSIPYMVFEISDGTFYRIAFPESGFSNSTEETRIELSRDGMDTWETLKVILYDPAWSTYYVGLSRRNSICNDYRAGLKPSTGYDYIIDKPQNQTLNTFGYGESESGCYLGLSALANLNLSLDEFVFAIDCWDTQSGRGDADVDMLVTLDNEKTIVRAFGLTPTAADNLLINWVRATDYVGYDCLRKRDPNCGQICAASYPNTMLKVTSCSYSIDGAITKTVESNTGFDAADGFPNLVQYSQLSADFPTQQYFDTLAKYDYETVPEYKARGVARCYAGNHAQVSDYLPNPCKYICEWSNILAYEVVPDYFYWPGYYPYLGGFGGVGGGPRPIGALGAFVPKFTWVGGGSEDKYVVDFTLVGDPAYGERLGKETLDQDGELTVEVVEETECTVTLELSVKDDTLLHGDGDELSGARPYWEAELSVVKSEIVSGRYTYFADYQSQPHWGPVSPSDYDPGLAYGVILAKLQNWDNTLLGPWGDGSEQLPNANYNTTWPDFPTSGIDVLDGVLTSSTDQFGVLALGQLRNPGWTGWRVTFRKAIQKADLPTTTLVEFTADDIYSSSYTDGRKTLTPDTGSGSEVCNQVSVAEIINEFEDDYAGDGREYIIPTLAYTLKPRDDVQLVDLVPSDWSATITLDPTPYV